MPLERCEVEDQPGWRWGQAGKCYVFVQGDEESEKVARKRALAQGIAMGDIKLRSDTAAWERRTSLETVEYRQVDGRPLLVGVAVRYNQLSANLGGFVERAIPGVAAKTIQEQDIRGLFNHDPSNLLGRLGAGTLRMLDDPSFGVRYEIDPPDTTLGRDVVELVRRGDIPGSSFGFMVMGRGGATWTRTSDGYPVRELRSVRIRDVGPVTFPAYSGADVALRSLAENRMLSFEEVQAAALEGRLLEIIGETSAETKSHSVVRRRYL